VKVNNLSALTPIPSIIHKYELAKRNAVFENAEHQESTISERGITRTIRYMIEHRSSFTFKEVII
jgi:hypothetical protein